MFGPQARQEWCESIEPCCALTTMNLELKYFLRKVKFVFGSFTDYLLRRTARSRLIAYRIHRSKLEIIVMVEGNECHASFDITKP